MRLGAKIAMWGGETPLPYDAEVEYLGFTSRNYKDVQEYIITEVCPNNTFEFEIDCLWFQGHYTTYGQEPIAWRAQNPTDRFSFDSRFMLSSYNTRGYSFCADGPHWYYSVGQPSNTRLHFEYHGNTLTTNFDGSHTFANSRTFESNFPVYLGAVNTINEGLCNPFGGNIYSCKMWLNGVLVRDYIPVRVGTTGYMYDRVSCSLFGNAGSGSFVVGPDYSGGVP